MIQVLTATGRLVRLEGAEYPAEPAAPSAWRDPIARAVRRQVYANSDGACTYCGVATVPTSVFPLPDNARTIDHVVARSRGGADTADNLVLACWQCNKAKGREPLA